MITNTIIVGETHEKSTANINIEEYIGHLVKAEIKTRGLFGDTKSVKEGRIIYTTIQDQLFFLPKGGRSRGYKIDEDSIYSVQLIRKDKNKHAYYLSEYVNREQKVAEHLEREERAREQRFAYEQQLKEQRALQLKEEKEAKISFDNALPGHQQMVEDVLAYYHSFEGDYVNESFATNIVASLLSKLVNKAVPNLDEEPKHYFDKKRNPKFCALIEQKTGIKLGTTQKGNVERLNQYLASKR